MEHKAYRLIDCETNLINISRGARFLVLGNGTFMVDFPMSEPQTRRNNGQCSIANEKDVERLLIEEELKEDNPDTDMEHFKDTEYAQNEEAVELQCPITYDYAAKATASAGQELVNHQEAMESAEWRAATDELESHRRNHTWELAPLPEDKRLVGSKWIFKLK